MPFHRLLLVSFLAALSLSVAGCGDGGGGPASDPDADGDPTGDVTDGATDATDDDTAAVDTTDATDDATDTDTVEDSDATGVPDAADDGGTDADGGASDTGDTGTDASLDTDASADADASDAADTADTADVPGDVADAGDVADTADVPGDVADAGDAADDVDSADGSGASTDADTGGPSCDYFELDTAIVACGDDYRYLRVFRDTIEAPGCPDFVRIGASPTEYPDAVAAIAGEGCSDTCIWGPATSVTWLRCGRRSGYIVFRSPACNDLYEMPEGIFASLEDHDAAHPCPVETRPAGQCATSADCPGLSTCTASAPGGICNGCGSIDDCPDAADECSEFGSCARTCTVDSQCPRGQECSGIGLCRISGCVEGACPDPAFGCSTGGLCERVACPVGDECPAGTTCTEGRCIEPL
jgi:hypothetical protein